MLSFRACAEGVVGACSVAIPAPRTGAGAGLRGPPSPGRAVAMAASLWMGDVSEGGRPGPRRRNLSVARGGILDPERVEVNGEGSF